MLVNTAHKESQEGFPPLVYRRVSFGGFSPLSLSSVSLGFIRLQLWGSPSRTHPRAPHCHSADNLRSSADALTPLGWNSMRNTIVLRVHSE
jgi:hypothetical protein